MEHTPKIRLDRLFISDKPIIMEHTPRLGGECGKHVFVYSFLDVLPYTNVERELHNLRLAANEAGALRVAKNKLEKRLEDLTWRLTLEKRLRVTSEDSKAVEVSKFQKALESLSAELNSAKSATKSDQNKNSSLLVQLDTLSEEQFSVESLAKRNSESEKDLDNAQKHNTETIVKMHARTSVKFGD